MKAPLLPSDESVRQEAVDELKLASDTFEANFDRITRLLGTLVDVPITAFSVIDNDRQFFKASQGLDVRETPRDVSFCGHAILQDDIMVIEDASGDERFGIPRPDPGAMSIGIHLDQHRQGIATAPAPGRHSLGLGC